MTKTEAIRGALIRGEILNPMIGLHKYGTFRLAAVIHSLKKRGMDIQSRFVKSTDRYGKSIHYSEYYLK